MDKLQKIERIPVDCAIHNAIPKSFIYFNAIFWQQLNAGLLCRQIADDRQSEFFIVVGLDHQENPAAKHGQTNQCIQKSKHAQAGQTAAGEKHTYNDLPPHDYNSKAGKGIEKRLEGVEAHKADVFIRINHQKDHGGNNTEGIAEKPGNIVRHAGACRSRRRGAHWYCRSCTGPSYSRATYLTKA